MSSVLSGATPADFLGLVGPLVTLVTGATAIIVARMALHTAAAVNLRNKRIDVIINCNARYDDLSKEKARIIKSISDLSQINGEPKEITDHDKEAIDREIELYSRRFWGLKSDQIDYWLAGYIDPETLISWFMSTIEAIHNPVSSWSDYKSSNLGGWNCVSEFHSITNARLFQVGEEISKSVFNSISNSERYARLYNLFYAIERDEKDWIDTLARNSRSRLYVSALRDKLPGEIMAHLR